MEHYEKYTLALLTGLQKPAVMIPAVGIATLSSCQLGLILLFGFMLGDFCSGLYASWVMFKQNPANEALRFWKDGFSSEKIRLSLSKSVTYFLFIMGAFGIESVFKIKSFKAETYTDHQITLTLISIAISCAIEFYSIFFENLPKAGFSIETQVKAIYGKVKAVTNALKNLRNGNNGSS